MTFAGAVRFIECYQSARAVGDGVRKGVPRNELASFGGSRVVPISRCLHHRGSGNPQRSVNSRLGAPAQCHGLPRRKGQRCSVISRRAGEGDPVRHIIGACATSFDRLRSTSLSKTTSRCAATHHCAQRTILFLASRTERQSLPRFCKLPLKKRLKTLPSGRKRRLFIFAFFSSFRRFAQLFSIVLVCSADFVRERPILPCFFFRDVV